MNDLAVVQTAQGLEESPDFQGIVKTFIRSIDVSEASRSTYERRIKPFVAWARKRPLVNPTRADILSCKDHLKSQNLSAFTVSAYMTVVRKFFEWAEGQGHYLNIAKGIKGAKKPKGFRRDPPTVTQIRDMLDAVDRTTEQGKRD